MMYLLFNEYGAIKDKQINEWIVQGSNNVNKIGVAIDGVDPTSFALVGVCKLPNGEVITTEPVDEQAEIIDGVYGVVFSLSKKITALEGTLRINIQAINTTTDKVITSYTVFLCVNEGVDPGEILMMTADQYQDLLSKIELDVQQDETILTFSALPLASNYSVGQVIYVRNSSVKKLYECVSNNDNLEWHETFNFNDHYTIGEVDSLLLDKQDKLTIALETAQLQYAVGFDSQGNLRKGAGGGGGGATYTAGPGIDITDFTISIDDTVVETKTHAQDTYATKSSVESIEALIPAQATSENKLADKDFVNSSISTNTANFLGTFNLVTDLELTTSATHSEIATAIATKLASLSITPTNNDYVFVAYPDATVSTQFTQFDRYKYNASLTSWEWEYTLNNSSFTAQQWAAINSGITASMIANFVDLDSAQTITGEKTFDRVNFVGAQYNSSIRNGYQLFCGNDEVARWDREDFIFKSQITPLQNGQKDIGRSYAKWRNLYLSGKIKDGTNEFNADNVFNVINASDIVNNTLTQAQYDLITNGKPTLIKGTLRGYDNMLLFPTNVTAEGADQIRGLVFGVYGNYNISFFCNFYIVKSTRVFNLNGGGGSSSQIRLDNGSLAIQNVDNLNGKNINYYLNNVYPYASNATTELKYETINEISVSADTTYSLATAPADTYPEYKANITNSGANAINLTFTGVSVIKTNDSNITIASNVLTLPAGTTIECSIVNGKMIAFNWSAN